MHIIKINNKKKYFIYIENPFPAINEKKDNNNKVDEQILLNISGHKFKCMRSILNKYPKTLLGSNELDYYYDDKTKEYFFDRDPKMFRHILNFYRTGKLHYPKSECLALYEQELALFGIQTDSAIADCCFGPYIDKKRKNDLFDSQTNETNRNKATIYKINVLTIRQRLCLAFEEPKSSILSVVLYYVIGFFIIMSVLANVFETVHLDSNEILGEKYNVIFQTLDFVCVLIFTIEYLLRFYSAPNRFVFVISLMNIIDLLSILPFYIMLIITSNNSGNAFATLRVLRVFRVLKFARHSQSIKVIGLTLQASFGQFSFLLFALSMAVVVFATVIYHIEKNVKNTKFTSIPQTFWYVSVTLTTLG
jgi:potassium voltage-gated channel Shal-related subfamily D member 2